MEPFLGQIQPFGFNFNPRGWAFCDGTLLPINSNSALFSLYGTIYGGDGRTTFGLPDLRGRVMVGFGNGPGLSNYPIGQRGGAEQASPSGSPGSGMVTTNTAGDGQSVNNLQPFLAVNMCCALVGTFPSRS